MSGLVYFLRPVGSEGPVKIGYSGSPPKRLEQYLAWSPSPLEIVATFPGDRKLEGRIHTLLRAHWSHHEWFQPHLEVLAVIDAIRAGTFDVTGLPVGRKINPRTCSGWTEATRLAVGWRARLRHIENKRRLKVPEDVWRAACRYDANHLRRAAAGLPEDRHLVESFLANHPPAAKWRGAA